MTRTIVIRNGRVKGTAGWLINSTDGWSMGDRLNTADPIKAKAHVDHLLAKGYQFKPYTLTRWQTLQECAIDWSTFSQEQRNLYFSKEA